MLLRLHFLPLLPLAAALGILDSPAAPALPAVPTRLTVAPSVATYAASIASARATALATQNVAGISDGAPNLSLPDPCGPADQAPGTGDTKSTCLSKVSTNHTSTPQKYGVTCLENNSEAISAITQKLDVNACANAMIEICYSISGQYGPPVKDYWVFTNGTSTGPGDSFGAEGGGNCTVGYWLPQGGAPPPSFLRCVDSIFGPLVGTCGTEANGGSGGSVNLASLPTFGVGVNGEGEGGVNQVGYGGSGQAVDAGYPSYFFVP